MGKGKGRLLTFFPTFHRLSPAMPDPAASLKGWLRQTLTLGGKQGPIAKSKLPPNACQKTSLKVRVDPQLLKWFARIFLPRCKVSPTASLLYFLVASYIVKHSQKLREMLFISNPNAPNYQTWRGHTDYLVYWFMWYMHYNSTLDETKRRELSPRHPRKLCMFCFASHRDVP